LNNLNIFVLDENPAIAARMLCDRHVSKMILETAQILSAVAARYNHPNIYKVTHANHPCTLWAGDRRANWEWLVRHGMAMGGEKLRRTGKGHKSLAVIYWYQNNDYGPPEDGLSMSPFALAMPDTYKDTDAIKAYRNYYLGDKQFFRDGKRPTWKNAETPSWWEYR
jgi:hypothetical protein